MKKIKVLLFGIVCFICLFLTTGCNKTAISSEDFKATMDGKGYRIIDATSQFTQAETVKQVYVALSSDSTYQIEFYEFETDENGLEFYDINTEKFIKGHNKKNKIIKTLDSSGNYKKMTISADNKYQVVSRIGNTAVYVDVDDKYKDIVIDELKDLGY